MKLEFCKRYAIRVHGRQKYGVEPYKVHLMDVYNVAKIFKCPRIVKCCTFLHDVLEDTRASKTTIRVVFGGRIARMIYAVTNKNTHRETYKAIRREGKLAVQLKLCDRYANTLACIRNNPRLLYKYKKDYTLFRRILYKKGECAGLWRSLDSLYGVS